MDPSPPAGGDEDRGGQLIALYWAMSGIAILVVAMRFAGRIVIRQVGADDYMMLLTLILFLILAAFATYYASIGGCRHLYYLTPAQQRRAIKYNWITHPWGIMGFATGKVAVALLIARLLGPRTVWRRRMLSVAMVTVVVVNAIGCIFTFVQCDPPRALWQPELVAAGDAQCWDPDVHANYALFLSAWNIFIDVLLAGIPVTLCWSLHLHRRQRVQLCVLLSLGLLAAAAGVVKTTYLAGMRARADLTWETYHLFAWSGAELFVIIVCGSVPPIKPLVDRCFKRKSAGYTAYGSDETHRSKSLGNRSAQSRRTLPDDYDLDDGGLLPPPPTGYVRKATEVRVH